MVPSCGFRESAERLPVCGFGFRGESPELVGADSFGVAVVFEGEHDGEGFPSGFVDRFGDCVEWSALLGAGVVGRRGAAG